MILFVMEGQNEEDRVLKTLCSIFFPDKVKAGEILWCHFDGDNHSLYKKVKEYSENEFEPDVFQLIKEKLNSKGNHTLDKYRSYQIEAVYIFFDYDPHNSRVDLNRLNKEIQDMVELFNDPMENGQIFISYPMSEALFCLNDVTDKEYNTSKISITKSKNFKQFCNQEFTFGKNKELLLYEHKDKDLIVVDDKTPMLKKNWIDVVRLNAIKANTIVQNIEEVPDLVDDIDQKKIFVCQSKIAENNSECYILSAYPLFLFEYFHGNDQA